MRLSDFLEQRARLAADLRTINDAATDGVLDSAQQGRFDELRTQLDALETRIQRQATIDDLDRRMRGTPIDDGRRDLQRAKREFSLCKLIASTFDGNVDAGREREICQEQRSLTGKRGDGLLVPYDCLTPQLDTRGPTVYSGTGKYLVEETLLENQFIDALRPSSVAIRLGAQVLTGLVGDIAIPKRSTRAPAVGWFAENGSIPDDPQAFTEVTGAPHHLGAITQFGRRTMLQATPGIEQLARQHLMAELAVGIDKGILIGAGTAEPTGITLTPSIGTYETVGGPTRPPNWDDIVTVLLKPLAANVPAGSEGWVFAASELKKFLTEEKLEDSGEGFLADIGAGTLAGKPFAVTSQMTANQAIYGHWNQVILAMWSGVEILVNPYAGSAYAKGNVSVRAITDADVLVRHPKAFVHWTVVHDGTT